jgi:hypothetical protein
MNASLASLAYLAAGDLGFIGLIVICVVLLLGCVVFAVIFSYILKSFLHHRQENIDAGDGRQERKMG